MPDLNLFGLWHGEKRSNVIQPVIIMGLYHHRNLIGSISAFSIALTNKMSEATIEIKGVANQEDLQKWEDHMLIKAKCWNQFCDGLYSENELRAVHVVKEDKPNFTYLTTLCEDCIKYTRSYGIIVKEKYLMVERHPKK